ncbi:MerR family transcriptional regulator [Lactococcus insecticola]|uniref:Transcriptional regulator n=1 Tax=Pseudolactococcus insecticola TaxID=2709158 RepID=A0A6A0B7X6_9LACT|nr:MerR family transcriptional regulator [Lactococcus insecticola]GFH40568.1 transcriptional regulator [Lactococcus insecticola]
MLKNNDSKYLIDFENLIFSIREISKISGATTRQIRYWDDQGYIPRATRTSNEATREYGYETLLLVIFVQNFLTNGLTLQKAFEAAKCKIEKSKRFHSFISAAFKKIEISDDLLTIHMGQFDDDHLLIAELHEENVKYHLEPVTKP